MPRRGTVVTYGRRHQLRQVHADADDWGSVFGKEEKDPIFGSSFSSGQDSSTKLSDSSSDFSTRKPKRSDKTSKTKQQDKENVVKVQTTRKTRRRKSCIYNISDGASNTSSELDRSTRNAKPLRERNNNTKVTAKPLKGRKVANKRKTRKKEKEDEPVENQHSRLFDISQRAESKAVHYEQHFSEFEEFSLCIEVEEEKEEDRVVINVPPNLTQSSDNNSKSSLHSAQRSTPNIHTSTPQMARDDKQDLFRRLTKSNLAKLAASGGMSPGCNLSIPGANGSILGAVSPAFSNISHRRDSMESNFGADLNTSRDSGVNRLSASSFMVTTRRRRQPSQNSSNMFSMSSFYSPAPPAPRGFTPIAEDAGAETRDLHDMSVDQDHEVAECEEQLSEMHISSPESHPSQQDSKSSEGEAAHDLYKSAKDFRRESGQLHPDPRSEQDKSSLRQSESDKDSVDSPYDDDATQSYTEGVDLHGDNNAARSCIEDIDCEECNSKLPANLETPAALRGCGVILDRLPDSVVSQYTQPASSDYDASKSLFDDVDLQQSPLLSVNKSTDYDTAEDKSPVANLCQNNQYYASSEATSDGELDEEDYTSALSDDQSLLSRIDELEESYRSLKVLTPLKSRSSGRVLSPRTKVLLQCDQEEPITFNECIPPHMMKKCVKIGEGVYGEVYRTENRKASVALKIIPIEGDFTVNDEPQKTFAEILTEIVISQTLSDLCEEGSHSTQNYVQVHSCSVVEGAYPDTLIKGWDKFHHTKVSENDRPDTFPDTQLFIIFEFADSGCDLEGFKFQSLTEAKSVLLQVAVSLAVAESALEFEHRDLHWGNVLVKRTEEKTLDYTLADEEIELRTHGVRVAIIDFTLSRLRKDGCTVSSDLSQDPTLFEGQGDYQFDVYRAMKEENGNNWEPFHPYTNVLWIHYLADKLLRGKVYPRASTKAHQAMCRQFRTLMREALDYQSAAHLISSCSFFTDEFINI